MDITLAPIYTTAHSTLEDWPRKGSSCHLQDLRDSCEATYPNYQTIHYIHHLESYQQQQTSLTWTPEKPTWHSNSRDLPPAPPGCNLSTCRRLRKRLKVIVKSPLYCMPTSWVFFVWTHLRLFTIGFLQRVQGWLLYMYIHLSLHKDCHCYFEFMHSLLDVYSHWRTKFPGIGLSC